MESLDQLIEAQWNDYMAANPLMATRTGDHRFNDQLGEVTERYYEERIDNLQMYLDRATSFDDNSFQGRTKINYILFCHHLRKRIQRLQYRMYRIPVSTMGGFHTQYPTLGKFVPLRTIIDFENLLSRYSQIPRNVRNYIDLMKSGIAEGQIPPKVSQQGVAEGIREQLEIALDENPYLLPFNSFPSHFSYEIKNELKGRAIEAVTDQIFPAMEEFLVFFQTEYLPKCREEIGAIHFPDGKKFYQSCITYFTSLDLSAEDIHQIGLDEVSRIRTEMEEVMKQVEFSGNLKQFFEYLRTNEKFYAGDKEELMQKTALVLKKIDGKLPEIFKTLPRLPYGIREIPSYEAPHSTTAYYMPGTGDGTKSGTYYVNTYDLKSRPLYEIEALSLHEAVPGHHLQISLQMEVDLPEFRKFGGYTSFVEGWGLYSERLGLELGFYEDPFSNFGRLSYEMWRALRLVVDTGMHVLGWSRQKAIDFMTANSSLTLLNITNEVDRYIGWPGQALAYKLGELKIRELRMEAEEKLGSAFDVREFHDLILLDGALPLDVLTEKAKSWIKHQSQAIQ